LKNPSAVAAGILACRGAGLPARWKEPKAKPSTFTGSERPFCLTVFPGGKDARPLRQARCLTPLAVLQTEVESTLRLPILVAIPPGRRIAFSPVGTKLPERKCAPAVSEMQFNLLKSKIHRATVTGGNVRYEGSLTIDSELMDHVGMVPYERILCSNMENGNRFETYAIPGDPGSGAIILNGAAAHMGKKGDSLTIMSFTNVARRKAANWKPRVIVLGKKNRIVNSRGI